jgi:CheY-like chemotaxis protein
VKDMTKILVVDDEPDVLALVKIILEGTGFEVVTANDGVEGLWKARHGNPDLVLTDMVMLGLTGIDLLKKLKSKEETHKIPVIILSVLDRNVDLQMFKEAGADDFFTKPLDAKDILAFVQKIKDFLNRPSGRKEG